MHHIVLVLLVFQVHTVGDGKIPASDVQIAPGATMEQCEARGRMLTARLKTLEGIADAEFKCVDFIEKAAI